MIQLFMKRSGSPVIVPLNLPASHDAMTEAASQLDEASRAGKTEIVEIKSVIANLPSYLSGLDPGSRTQLAQLNQLSSIIAKMDSRERNIYAGALDGKIYMPKLSRKRNSLASKLWVIMWSWYSKNASKEEKSPWRKLRLSHSKSPRSWTSG